LQGIGSGSGRGQRAEEGEFPIPIMGRMYLRCLPVWACLVACIGCSGGPDPGPASSPNPEAAAAPQTSSDAPKDAPRAATKKAPSGTAAGPEPLEPAAKPAPRETPKSSGARRAAPEVSDLLNRLRSTPEEAGKAYREIWEAPRGLIPKLIPEVANDQPSGLRELAVLVLDRNFAQVDAKDGTVAYDIPGMGKVKYDDIVVGKAPRGLKVILRRLEQPFPVGAAIRAGLLNRFRSTDYPGGSDVSDPVGWWQRFYDRVRAKL